jgi:hypothetical protein
MRDDLKAEFVLDALGMAVTTRGDAAAGVAAHSDKGSQLELRLRRLRRALRDRSLKWLDWRPVEQRRGGERLRFAREELLRRERWASREEARLRVFRYVECFCNRGRGHSSLGMLSPIDYALRHQRRRSRPNDKVLTDTEQFHLTEARRLKELAFCRRASVLGASIERNEAESCQKPPTELADERSNAHSVLSRTRSRQPEAKQN